MPQLADLTGQRFGRLKALDYRRSPIGTQGRVMVRWRCVCDCGAESIVLAVHLTRGKITSCGCRSAEMAAARFRALADANPDWGKNRLRHGLSKSKEYSIWNEMVGRCHRETSSRYRWYGARGIKVCDRWRFGENGKSGFHCFIDDMGIRTRPGLSIDRINNDGDYEPSNCRWTTWDVQCANKRKIAA